MDWATDISVVIPHLNQPEHLRRCLDSLESQEDAKAREIIVVDNGSRELPEDVCQAFGASLLQEATAGPGPARNTGVAASSGAMLAFIDADCIAAPQWLAAIGKHFTKPETMILGGDVRIWREDPKHTTMLECYESVYAYQMRDYIRRKGFTGTGNLAVRREVLEAVGPFAGIETAEDIDWGHRATDMGYTITYAPDAIAYHPARKSLSELYEKWDRHMSHFWEAAQSRPLGRLKWLAQSAVMGVSPLAELPKIITSDRVSGLRERRLAFQGVCAVRFYRACGMFRLAMGSGRQASRDWNRG